MRKKGRFHPLVLAIGLGLVVMLPACGDYSLADRVAKAQEYIQQDDLEAAAIELRSALQSDPNSVEARSLLGTITLELGDGAAAEKELIRAVELGFAASAAQPLIASAILLQGDYDRLLEQTSELAPEISPQDKALILSLRGQAHLVKSEFYQASEDFQTALDIAPTSVEALVGMSTLNGIQNDLEAAREWAKRALEADKSSPIAWSALGAVELAEGNLEKAETAFTKSIKYGKFPGLDRAKRAFSRIELGKFDEAEADLKVLTKKRMGQHPYVAYVAGVGDFRQGNYEDAAQEFTIAYDSNPKSLLLMIYLAETHRLLGNLEQATSYAQKAYTEAPQSLASQRILGAVQISNSELAAAKSTLEEALTGAPDDPSTLSMLAGISNLEGDTAKTVDYLERLLALQPDAREARNALTIAKMLDGQSLGDSETSWDDQATDPTGELLGMIEPFRDGNYSLALQRARLLSERDPDNVQPLLMISACYLQMGDWSKAREQLEAILAIDPQELSAARNLAILEARDGNLDRARTLLSPVVAGRPQDEEAVLLLADIVSMLGKPEDALPILEAALVHNPKDLGVITTLAQAYFLAGRYNDVVAVTGKGAEEDFSGHPRMLELRGKSQMLAGDVSGATHTFELLVKAFPDSAEARNFYADSLLKGGDRARAQQEIDRAVQIDPNYLPARIGQIRLLAEAGNTTAALEAMPAAEKQFGDQPQIQGLYGWLYLLNGNFAAAEERLALATKQLPDTALTGYLVKALWEQAKYDQAVTVMQQWLERYPSDLAIRLRLSSAYLSLEKFTEARSSYAAMLEFYPNFLPALNNLAFLLGEAGDLDAAIGYAQRAYEISPSDATVLDTLGTLLLRKGDITTAYGYIHKATELSPGDQDIQLHLGDALIQTKKYEEAGKVLRTIVTTAPDSQAATAAKALLASLPQ